MRIRITMAALTALMASGCVGSKSPNGTDAGTDDGGHAVAVERGPKAIAIDGDPNGLFWDAAQNRLLIADDNHDRVLAWTDASGFGTVADLPASTVSDPGLGGIVKLADGTIVVARFGGGTAGDIVFISADGSSHVVPGLDPKRRRLGLTVGQDGKLYDSYFVKTDVQLGSVAELSLTTGETEVIGNLKKPVGILATADAFYIADQSVGTVFKAPLADLTAYTAFATVGLTSGSSPDLLSQGPAGRLYTGGGTGSAFQIDVASGAISPVGSGFQQVHGTAYDAVNKRLFVADHDGDPSNGETHFIQILPVDDAP